MDFLTVFLLAFAVGFPVYGTLIAILPSKKDNKS